jgi:hypothetical protein|tara:strand:- start:197 stop:634 length:438 start_codon:yes stop_codon:yes gene_type:complete
MENNMYTTSDDAFDAYREELYSYFSDVSKEAYGSRVRLDIANMSVADIELKIDQAEHCAMLAQQDRDEEAALCVRRFEANVSSMIEMGAADRSTAIRWIVDANGMGDEDDIGYIEYQLGLPFRQYADEIDHAINHVLHSLSYLGD